MSRGIITNKCITILVNLKIVRLQVEMGDLRYHLLMRLRI